MNNIEKIRQEIERRKKSLRAGICNDKAFTKKQKEEMLVASEELTRLSCFIDSLPEESENHGCGVEFPHFGANYPDAKCIDGYLWDMDSYEDGIYTIGGDDPCPICNTEKWLKDVLDDGIFKTRDEALEYVKMLKSKYGKHKDSLPDEICKDSLQVQESCKENTDSFTSLEEAAEEYAYKGIPEELKSGVKPIAEQIIKNFIAGAKWQANQLLKGSPLPEDTVLFQKGVEEGKRLMMEEAVEGEIGYWNQRGLSIRLDKSLERLGYDMDTKVKIIIIKGND